MKIYYRPDKHKNGVPMSDFTWEIQSEILLIEDLDQGGRSVTNDVRNVITYITTEGGPETINALGGIIYRDSMGNWDEITKDGNFKGLGKKIDGQFFTITDKDEAVAAIREKKGFNKVLDILNL